MKKLPEEKIAAVFSELRCEADGEHGQSIEGVECEVCDTVRQLHEFRKSHPDETCTLDLITINVIHEMSLGELCTACGDTAIIAHAIAMSFTLGLKVGRGQAIEETMGNELSLSDNS